MERATDGGRVAGPARRPSPVMWFGSPRLALGVLSFLAVWCGVAAWLPWTTDRKMRPPGWADLVGLSHPFSSAPFLVALGLLFTSTLVCTLRRIRVLRARLRGVAEGGSVRLTGDEDSCRAFLVSHGFRERRGSWFRHRWAIPAGFVMHLGLLLLMAGVVAQSTLHDGGAFELTEGEAARLDTPEVVFDRTRGMLAPPQPPPLQVALDRFDPYLHQSGYARDRGSRIRLELDGADPVVADLDRSRGIPIGLVTVFQAIPFGLSLVLDTGGAAPRSIHLHDLAPRIASADVEDDLGEPYRFTVETEGETTDPETTGRLRILLRHSSGGEQLEIGRPFPFGSGTARIVAVRWWGDFTYSVSPGMPGVLLGFAVIVAGCTAMLFPAGALQIRDGGIRGWVSRGAEILIQDWADRPPSGRPSPGATP